MSQTTSNTLLLFPKASLGVKFEENAEEKEKNPVKSELELKRELLRKKKAEMEKKFEKNGEIIEGFF